MTNGCKRSNTPVSITIYAVPTPTLTNNPVSPVCANRNVTYATDASKTNYIWTFSGVAGTDHTIVSGGNNTIHCNNNIGRLGLKLVTINDKNSNGW